MTAQMPEQALDLVKDFEGYHKKLPDGRAAPYLCPARVPTVAFGATYYEDGTKVRMSDPPITRERGEAILSRQMLIYLASVDRSVTTKMHPLMRGAAGSLAYNIGTGAFRKSTVVRMINQQRWSEVPRAWSMWRMGGGRVLAGLERRRKAEIALFTVGLKEMLSGRVAAPMPARAMQPQVSFLERFFGWLFGEKVPA